MKSAGGQIQRFNESFYQTDLPVVGSDFPKSPKRKFQLHGVPIAHSPEALEYCNLSVISEQMKLDGHVRSADREDFRHFTLRL